MGVLPVKDHYKLDSKQYDKLMDNGVTVVQMFKAMPLFDPYKTGTEVGLVSLLYYVDAKGDFNSPPKFPHKKIAKAVFEMLPIKDKILVAEYIEDSENNFEGEDDE